MKLSKIINKLESMLVNYSDVDVSFVCEKDNQVVVVKGSPSSFKVVKIEEDNSILVHIMLEDMND